jgi:hypothetical protein
MVILNSEDCPLLNLLSQFLKTEDGLRRMIGDTQISGEMERPFMAEAFFFICDG